MLLFPVLFAAFFGLQWLHARFLRHLLPESVHRWIPWVLVLIHVPLAVYMGLRFSGLSAQGVGGWIQPLARGAFYFQALTVLNLIGGYAAEALYRVTHRRRADRGLEAPDRRSFLQGAATAGLGAVAVGGGFGWAQAHGDPQVSRHELAWPGLAPGLDGLRILHLSDLHAGPLAGAAVLRRWAEAARRERAELVVVTGDLVDSLPTEIAGFTEAFAGFPASLGRFAVLGNHDHFTDPGPIWTALEGAGWRCLENAGTVLERRGSSLALFGLQDPQALDGRFRGVRFGPGPRPDLAVKGLPPEAFRICLSHRPSLWRLARRAGADLTLAGHTHGGQINLVPGVNFARMLGPYTEGLFEEEGRRLFVSRGLGVVGVPMRVAAPPEIVVITLRRG